MVSSLQSGRLNAEIGVGSCSGKIGVVGGVFQVEGTAHVKVSRWQGGHHHETKVLSLMFEHLLHTRHQVKCFMSLIAQQTYEGAFGIPPFCR